MASWNTLFGFPNRIVPQSYVVGEEMPPSPLVSPPYVSSRPLVNTTFWLGVLGFLKAIVWPALLVFELLKYLNM